jgi:hypothetical protein
MILDAMGFSGRITTRCVALAVLLCLAGSGGRLLAQDQSSTPALPTDLGAHHFWDRKNDLLFAGVFVARALDYSSTLNMRSRGDQEWLLNNATVDNHGLFAGIEVSGVAASIGVSYLFHRTGHHRLERWVSIVHIGIAVGGAAHNYALPTVHPPA